MSSFAKKTLKRQEKIEMKPFLTIGLCLLFTVVSGQDKVEWSPEFEMQFSDYKSTSSEINGELSIYSVSTSANIEFFFSMSYYEFMFTKNFNEKVSTVLHRPSSYITSSSQELANQLVKFGQLEFDLSELSARKFRKKLFESKGTFSNTNFFKPLYDEIITEQSNRHNELAKSTDLGKNVDVLIIEREKILQEIAELSDYCKTCKPPKKQKP
ncbi:MAG: hypothetical protein ACJA08_000626 [Cyclobacteriaceae bacterium]